MSPPVVNKQDRAAPTLRADAAENRAHLIKTAAEMFAKEGVGCSVEAIAKKAGLGIGTLYRHFPTKEALVGAIVTTHIERMTEHAQQLLATAPPMTALRACMERLVTEGAKKKDFVTAIGGYEKIAGPTLDAAKKQFKAVLSAMTERAQADGVLRPDVSPMDVMSLVNAINLGSADEATRMRQLDIIMAGLVAR
jgi:AcrR family transcriptional regulator